MKADIVVALIILAFSVNGYRRGFVRSGLKLISLALSVVAAKFLYPYVSSFVDNSFIGDTLYNYISKNTAAILGDAPPSFIQTAGDYTAEGLFNMSVNIVSIVIIVVAVFVISRVLLASLNIFTRLPVISFFNRTLGLAAGFVIGAALSYLLVALAVMTDAFGLASWLEGSVIASAMYSKNVIFDLIF